MLLEAGLGQARYTERPGRADSRPGGEPGARRARCGSRPGFAIRYGANDYISNYRDNGIVNQIFVRVGAELASEDGVRAASAQATGDVPRRRPRLSTGRPGAGVALSGLRPRGLRTLNLHESSHFDPRASPPATPRRTPEPVRPPYGLAAAGGRLVFALYAVTLAPTTAFWDTSEYIATAHILGIPHPPGNPLFVLMARAWELLLSPTGLAVAVRVNLFSALMGAGAAVLLVPGGRTGCSRFFTRARDGAAGGGGGGGAALRDRVHGVEPEQREREGVHGEPLHHRAALLDRLPVARPRGGAPGARQPGRWHDDNALVFMVFVLALSVGNHLMAFLAAPALLVFCLPGEAAGLRSTGGSTPGARCSRCVGLSVHLYLPIRAGLEPVINEADPTCHTLGGALASVLTFGKAGCEDLSAALRARAVRQAAGDRPARALRRPARQLLPVLRLAVGALADGQRGLPRARRASPSPCSSWPSASTARGVTGSGTGPASPTWPTLFATLSFGLVFYLNFKYGFGQVQALGLAFDAGRGARARLLLPRLLLRLGPLGRGRDHRALAARRRADARRRGRSLKALARAGARLHPAGAQLAATPRAPATTPRATGRTTSSSRWSRTGCSSPTATTTPSRSGTSRRWRGSGGT